jgi:hypothetical protein
VAVTDDTKTADAPLEAIADPRLLALVNDRLRPEIVRQHDLPSYIGEMANHLDPADWRTGFLSVVEGGAPFELREAMNEMTPQAQLRDLFRPEYSSEPVPLELHELPLDPGGRLAYGELRAALTRVPVPILRPTIELVVEERAKWRAFIDTPWQPFLRDDEPRREVYVVIEPSLSAR